MITSPRTEAWSPIIHMHMLHLCPPLHNSIRNENMIQLLGVLVEDVSVSFDRVDAGNFVQFTEDTIEWREDGTSLDEFVEVAGNNDVGCGVQFEEGLDERLSKL